MTQQHDTPSKSRRLTEDAKPANVGTVRKLRERIDELEKRIAELEKPQCQCTFGLRDEFCPIHGDGLT